MSYKDGYEFRLVNPDTPPAIKTRKLGFAIAFCVVILLQACYWLFANSATPFVLGMPFGMFMITLLIVIEFVMLLVLYGLESKETEE